VRSKQFIGHDNSGALLTRQLFHEGAPISTGCLCGKGAGRWPGLGGRVGRAPDLAAAVSLSDRKSVEGPNTRCSISSRYALG
jgi:hypothetical protein